jgi:hypothetical protein
MVQGLAFLSKKSWHVKNMNNQEKVWMAEQRKANEESKTKELARQIQQEREQDELDAIAGKKSSHLDRGIAWMHEGGTGEAAKEDQRKQDEEFLLGKAYAPEGVKGGDFAVDEVQDGVNAVIAGAAAAGPALAVHPSQAGPSVADKNEAFRMRHEDPMFLVSKRHHEQQAKAEKTKALFERVVGPQDVDSEDSYEERKKAKRAKKERKRERMHRYRNDDDDDDDRKHRKHRHRSRSRDRKEDEDDRNSRKHRKQPSRSRSRSRSEERRTRSNPDRSDRTDYNHGDSHRRREYRRGESPSETRTRRADADDSKYGLQGSSRKDLSIDDLGPNRELLEKKRQEMDETRRSIMRATTSNRNKMSEEERAKALEDMQNDASRRADAARTRPRDHEEDSPKRASASFLSDMKQKTHGIQGTSTQSMSTRVRENRHRNQKLDASFL